MDVDGKSGEPGSYAVNSTGRVALKSFWYVARVGLPLMLLAAVLGAVAAETIPQQGTDRVRNFGGNCLGGFGRNIFAGADSV